MRNYFGPLALLFWCLALSVSAATTDTPERKFWVLAADKYTEKSVVLTQGLTRAEVIELMGKRFSRTLNKKNPSLEILRYGRTIVGPWKDKLTNTPNGMVRVRTPIFYTDHVEITLREGQLSEVSVRRETQNSRGDLDPFGRSPGS